MSRAAQTPGGMAPLPGSLPAAVRAELRRARRPPYESLVVVLGNGVLMTVLWTLLPSSVVKSVFAFHGPLAFALVLASWMYSDVPATNLWGADPTRAIAALPDPAVLARLWIGKNIVLWLMITPLCAVVAVAIGWHEQHLTTTALSIIWIAVVPLGALGFSPWLGTWYPYHPLPLRHRWAQRRRWWTMLVRWLILVLLPYALVPLLTAVLTLPSVLLWSAVAPDGKDTRISDAQFAAGLVLAGVLALIAWFVGHRAGVRLAHRRRERLTAFLADPDRG